MFTVEGIGGTTSLGRATKIAIDRSRTHGVKSQIKHGKHGNVVAHVASSGAVCLYDYLPPRQAVEVILRAARDAGVDCYP